LGYQPGYIEPDPAVTPLDQTERRFSLISRETAPIENSIQCSLSRVLKSEEVHQVSRRAVTQSTSNIAWHKFSNSETASVLTQNSQYNSIVIPDKLAQLARPGIQEFQRHLDTAVRPYDG